MDNFWAGTAFTAFENGLNGSAKAAIHQFRKAEFAKFEAAGFPSSKDEDWKYTSLKELASLPLTIPSAEPLAQQLRPGTLPALPCQVVQIVNGSIVTPEVNLRAEVLQIKDSAELAQLQQRFTASTGSAINNLANAFFREALLVKVKKGVEVTEPLALVHVTTEDKIASFPQVFIELEENSSLNVFEIFIGTGNEYFAAPVTRINLAADARLTHTKIQQEAATAYHVGSLFISQAGGSKFKSGVFNFGGALVRNEIYPILQGEFCETLLDGLTVINAEQHVDNFTVIDHAKPNCFSREHYKGIYDADSHGVFSGTIIVQPDAQKTNAIQSNQSVLLSDRASVETRPQLKIWADDVKCTHGATVGQLDDHALFYIRSRGIDFESARRLLIHAFASEVIDAYPDGPIRAHLEELLLEKLGQEFNAE